MTKAQPDNRIDDLAQLWGLAGLVRMDSTCGHYVARATRGGTSVVLKVFAGPSREAQALQVLAGDVMVPLLAEVPDGVLLPAVTPGFDLASWADDQAQTEVFAKLLDSLPVVENSPLPPFHQQVSRLAGLVAAGPLAAFAPRAIEGMNWLQSIFPPVALHGDLHHHNILRAGDRWMVIDPHGYTGPRPLEVGAFCKNPIGILDQTAWQDILQSRLSFLADRLAFSHQVLATSAFVYGFVSAGWSWEDEEIIHPQFRDYLLWLQDFM